MPKVRKSIFTELDSVRNKLFLRFPQVEKYDFCRLMGKLGVYHYNKRKFFLLGLEKDLYNFLIENSYNPYTVYKWLLLEKIPEDIRFQLNERQISQRKAIKLSMERKRETDSELSKSIRQIGLRLVVEFTSLLMNVSKLQEKILRNLENELRRKERKLSFSWIMRLMVKTLLN